MSLNTILATAPLTATGYHLKATGTALGQSLIWDNGTNVGIGNQGTTYTLDVTGTGRFTADSYFATSSGSVGIATITPSQLLTIQYPFAKTDTSQRYIADFRSNDVTNPFALTLGSKGAAALANRSITLQTADNNLANGGNISLQPYGGNVGIGTSNVLSWYNSGYTALQIGGMAGIFSNTTNTSTTSALTMGYNIYVDSAGNYQYMNTTSARAASAIVMDGGAINFNNAVAATSANPTLTTRMTIQGDGNIVFPNNQTLKSTASSGYIAIYGNGGGLYFGGTTTNQLFLASNGKLTLNPTIAGDDIFNVTNTSSTGYGMSVQGGVSGNYSLTVRDYTGSAKFTVFGNGGVYAPNIGAASGTAMVLDSAGYLRTSTSSIRYKKDIKPIDIGLDFILSLNPVSYNLKNGDIPQVGFIAEDFPEDRLVSMSMIDSTDESKGYQRESVNYAQIVAPLVKAIQELNQLAKEQQIQIQNLQEQINILAK